MLSALYIAGFLAFAAGVAHSILGERYILVRLFRKADLPKLFGGTQFTQRTLRLAWHVTSIAWWGLAAVLIQLANGPVSNRSVALVVGLTFCATALVVFVGSLARHLAWPIFLFIGCIALYAAAN
jgi:hypothetical protein